VSCITSLLSLLYCLQCAHKLLKLIKRHSKTNIHKFELYALKNIFSSAASLTEDPPSSSRPEKQQRYPEILSSREQELESLRARYADLAGQNSFLRDEAALSELLLHGMDKTLFDLRVVCMWYDTAPPLTLLSTYTQRERESSTFPFLLTLSQSLLALTPLPALTRCVTHALIHSLSDSCTHRGPRRWMPTKA